MTTAPSSSGTARSALLEERSTLKINKHKALLQGGEGAEDKRQEAVLESQGNPAVSLPWE